MKEIVFIYPRTHNNIEDLLDEVSKETKIKILSYENNKPIQNKNITYIKLQNIPVSKKNQIHLPSFFQLWNQIQKDKLIVLKSFNNFETIFSLFICKLKKIKPIILVQKINEPRSKLFNIAWNSLFQFLLQKKTIKILSQTKVGLRESKKFTNYPYYVPFGIRIQYFKKKTHSTFNIICVSKIEPRKNVDIVIKVFYKFQKKVPKSKLFITSKRVFNKNYLEQITKLIDKTCPNKISTFFDISKNEMNELYSISDIYILASHNEPAAYSHLEAMNHGIPIIITPYNGTTNYIKNGMHGLILKEITIKNIEKSLENIYKANRVIISRQVKKLLKQNHDVVKISNIFKEINK